MNKKVMKLASRGKRVGAFAIDKILPFILNIVVLAAVVGLLENSSYGYSYGYGYGYGYGMRQSNGAIAGIIISLILFIIYAVVQLVFYTKSATIGKAVLGLQVVDSKKGEPIGFWKMLLREWFAKKASEVIFCIGYFWVLIDEKNRAWHDKIMDTYVVDLKQTASYKTDRSESEQKQDVVEKVLDENEIDTAVEAAIGYINETPEAVVEESEHTTDPEVTEEPEIPKVDMSMRKDELLEVAENHGIKINSKATKSDIIETINNYRG